MDRNFAIDRIVTMDDADPVGNVHFSRFISWQGQGREEFLIRCAPAFIDDIHTGRIVVTANCRCEYLSELKLGQTVSIRMAVHSARFNIMTLDFTYYRCEQSGETLVARGDQQVACVRRHAGELVPAGWPPEMVNAVEELGCDVSRAFVE
ncbi:acyl-CoA thioesterase [Haloechinothrix sp. LS1_15]|uniref:acyl-CoA thioesterase n=1 Tax=Haloechinothrix sp. LS1_15 TaxID=2652248 RepID=UPI0029448995|nr:acyl-CoA thioesterase [Haloechinothrix sp. LS1_15]MDV6012199.1 acyl-CoA thioesterase [Haloechinothrix sp. LS1_15]